MSPSPSDCRRLRISHLVNIDLDIYNLATRAAVLLQELRTKGIDDDIQKTLVKLAVNERDVQGLKTMIANVQQQIDNAAAARVLEIPVKSKRRGRSVMQPVACLYMSYPLWAFRQNLVPQIFYCIDRATVSTYGYHGGEGP